MILCLDAGNSRLKYGLHDGTAWRVQGALGYADQDTLARHLPAAPTRIIACNVAGTDATAQIERLAARLAVPLVWFSSCAEWGGVVNGYAQPEQLGADRWAALIGARALQPGNVLVVLAGTATTVDVLDADGVFRGGLILPGLSLMRASLAAHTANLPATAGGIEAFPTSTAAAIASGALEATLGAIERMARRIARAVPGDTATHDVCCLLSGGAAGELLPHLQRPVRFLENLVLEGLLRAG